MGPDVSEISERALHPCAVKVHGLNCAKLMKLVDEISSIFREIEAARPRCSSGIQALCYLNSAVGKAKLIVQNCSESSKLYLAFTGNVIVSRCERSRDLLQQSLSQIKNMVPVTLATKIAQIVEDLSVAKFYLDSSEEEAGQAVRALFQQDTFGSDSGGSYEIETFKLAASVLHINSSKALLIEKRSIKKQLNIVCDTDTTKKKILIYLLYLLKKYGNLLTLDQTKNESPRCKFPCHKEDSCVEYGENEGKGDLLSQAIPPKQFICPLSFRLMHDPVVIDSGETFERASIQKWFDDGNDVCPITRKKLSHLSLAANTAVKELISRWCNEHGVTIPDPCLHPEIPSSWEASSIASFGSSVNDLCFRMDLSNISLGSLDGSSSSDSPNLKRSCGSSLMAAPTDKDPCKFQASEDTYDIEPEHLTELATLSWECQCKLVEDVKRFLVSNERPHYLVSSGDLFSPLTKFLEDAKVFHDVNALQSGSQLLLALASNGRWEKQHLDEDVLGVLTSLLNSEVGETVLAIVEVVSRHRCCNSKLTASSDLMSVLMGLSTQTRAFRDHTVKILCNLSSNSENHSLIVSLGFIPKLVPLVAEDSLVRYCIDFFQNLCEAEAGRVCVGETKGCIGAIAELVEHGSTEEQEHAVAVLLTLCSQRAGYCQLVMEEAEDVFVALADVSMNGNEKGRASACELLRILRDFGCADVPGCSRPVHLEGSDEKPKEKRSSSKSSGFLRRFPLFSKPSKKK